MFELKVLQNNHGCFIKSNHENRFLHSQQRNKCVSLLRNTKKNYHERRDI